MGHNRTALFFAATGPFWMHVYVALYSVLVNTPDADFDVYVVGDDPDPRFLDNLPFLETLKPGMRISVAPVPEAVSATLPAWERHAPAVFYKIAAAEVVPESVETVLYLDGDTVAVDSIARLLATPLGGHVFGGVPERQPRAARRLARLGLPAETPYLNSGVLLMDMTRWREAAMWQRCVAFVRENRNRLTCPEQEFLTTAFRGQWQPLAPRYNFMQQYVTEALQGADVGPPVIVHFTVEKPWQYGATTPGLLALRQDLTPTGTLNPYMRYYWTYLARTPCCAPVVADYRRRAESGDAATQALLGSLYVQGVVVERDPAAAAHWFHRAAEQGVAGAQYELGMMYRHGVGVPHDSTAAEAWLERAVSGDPAAGESGPVTPGAS